MDLRPLTDAELLGRLSALASQERECVADVVEHLAELERRGTVGMTGCNSTHAYAVRVLRYTDQAAFARIRAARAAMTDRLVIDRLRSGAVHLEAVVKLAPLMTGENACSLLAMAEGATTRQVEAIVARLDPEPPPERDIVRVVAAGAPLPGEVLPPPTRVRFSFTADGELRAILDELRTRLRHKFPEGRLEDIVKEAALWRLGADSVAKPRARKTEPATPRRRRWIPRAVKREVWERGSGRCSFVAKDGTRCESREFLEFDHIVPYAKGGRSDAASNIRLLCRPHNKLASKMEFERPWDC